MDIWHYSLIGVLSVTGFVVVMIYERIKKIESKVNDLIYQYERDNLSDKVDVLLDEIVKIEQRTSRL